MKISRKTLWRIITALFIIMILSGWAYVNGSVSYKYEVQDTEFAGDKLNNHQQSILNSLSLAKITGLASLVLCIILIIVNEKEPTFKGKITYKE